jgi:two-component system, OmpR family, response regulator ResD
VDDDPTVSEVVAGYRDRAGFTVDVAADGPAGVAAAAARPPDLVVLDLMLPGMDGLEVCRRIRAHGPLPVIMLTARGDEEDRVLGLEVGADDYVTKPFSPRELVLRVESVLRRVGTLAATRTEPAAPQLRSGPLALDPTARRATRRGSELALTTREFDLLEFFLRHPGRATSREELMRQVWGWEFGDLSTVTVHVRRLREKVEDDPARPRLINTVWGVGYRFDPPPSDGTQGRGADDGR